MEGTLELLTRVIPPATLGSTSQDDGMKGPPRGLLCCIKCLCLNKDLTTETPNPTNNRRDLSGF